MITCQACNQSTSAKFANCEHCGEPLPGFEQESTMIFSREDVEAAKAQKAWSSAQLSEGHTITVQIGDEHKNIRLPTDGDSVVTMGRFDGAQGDIPDVDLTEFKAGDFGVSRLHAEIRVQGDMVQVKDLDSTNGTFVNGQRVSSTEWRIVRDGDELHLGTLVLKLIF